MQKKIGNALLGIGAISTVGVLIWGWKLGILSFYRVGVAAGIERLFFFFLYLPVPIILAVIGGILAYKKQVMGSGFLRGMSLGISLLLLLIVIGSVGLNLVYNLKYYGGSAIVYVLALNVGFVFPLLFLSGVLFYIGSLGIRN